MPRETIPEHPDEVHEWKETVTAFIISLGVILLIFGTIALAMALMTEGLYRNITVPVEIQDAVNTGRIVAFILLLVGGAVIICGSVGYLSVRRPRNTRYF